MKMNRPFAREITRLKSGSSGHGVVRYHFEATKSNSLLAKVLNQHLHLDLQPNYIVNAAARWQH
jgi:hypothetical protein